MYSQINVCRSNENWEYMYVFVPILLYKYHANNYEPSIGIQNPWLDISNASTIEEITIKTLNINPTI
jgi:hypothetical protein